ncbi:MAG TPA: MATE family efflux transporter [Microlunatus sp.]|nr:MATE family efflux transporter [Microlunatus sp.]
MPTRWPRSRRYGALDREIFALALPTFATLVTEPLLLIADSAFIGHLGTDQLAGLGIASNLIGIVVGLCIFLAYGTTSTVARRLGAGDRRAALSGGIDGLVLALVLGLLLVVVLQLALPAIVGAYGPSAAVRDAALSYLRVAVCGLPSVLLLLAGTGVLRGLQDTTTPLKVAIATNVANIGLNGLLVYGVGLGITGSAVGTLIAQTGAALVIAVIVVRGARRIGVPLGFHPAGVLAAARTGVWLVARTATLQIAITLTTVVAAAGGTVMLAAYQVVNSIWVLLAFALDAIAIAGQSIIGRLLGAGDVALGRAMTTRMIGWGVVCGVGFGVLVAVGGPFVAAVFTPDPAVQQLVAQVLIVVALITPMAGVVYVLDGVLIGASDGRYLALAGAISLLAYVPLALTVRALDAGLVWLWVAYGGFMLARMLTLVLRARTDRWIRTGSDPV